MVDPHQSSTYIFIIHSVTLLVRGMYDKYPSLLDLITRLQGTENIWKAVKELFASIRKIWKVGPKIPALPLWKLNKTPLYIFKSWYKHQYLCICYLFCVNHAICDFSLSLCINLSCSGYNLADLISKSCWLGRSDLFFARKLLLIIGKNNL